MGTGHNTLVLFRLRPKHPYEWLRNWIKKTLPCDLLWGQIMQRGTTWIFGLGALSLKQPINKQCLRNASRVTLHYVFNEGFFDLLFANKAHYAMRHISYEHSGTVSNSSTSANINIYCKDKPWPCLWAVMPPLWPLRRGLVFGLINHLVQSLRHKIAGKKHVMKCFWICIPESFHRCLDFSLPSLFVLRQEMSAILTVTHNKCPSSLLHTAPSST